MREHLLAAERSLRDRPDEDHDLAPRPRVVPGKVRADELAEHPELARAPLAPGKATCEDLGRDVMSPAQALRYSDWISTARIDRRAEAEADDADGALATAFTFLDESPGGQPLPAELTARLARELGVDLAPLRVHVDAAAARAAAALHARAFTIGADIYFAEGAYDPASDAGIELIAHEVAHVAQNLRGGGRADRTGARVSRPGDPHERQADDFAARFQQQQRTPPPASALPFLRDLEAQLGVPLGDLDVHAGDAAKLGRELLSAGAVALRGVVGLAEPSPQRAQLLGELERVIRPEHAGAMHFAVDAAPAGTVHRDPVPGGATPRARFDAFVAANRAPFGADLSANDRRKDLQYGVVENDYLTTRLYHTSAEFDGPAYVRAIRAQHPGAQNADLTSVWREHGAELKLTRVGRNKFIRYADNVTHPEQVEKRPARPSWTRYKTAIDTLGTPDFTWPAAARTPSPPDSDPPPAPPHLDRWHAYDAAHTDAEVKAYRAAMREAIAAMSKYAADENHWDAYYNDVVLSGLLPNRITGDVFALICMRSPIAIDEAETFASPERGEPIFDKRTYQLTNAREARGDATLSFNGARRVIIEAKARQSRPSRRDGDQARNYKRIIERRGKGYVLRGERVEKHQFEHVIYQIADDAQRTNARLWYEYLFGGTEPIFTTDECSIIPRPDGAPEFRFRLNPEFTVPLGELGDPRTHYVIDEPRLGHPGVEFKRIDIRVDETKTRLLSGNLRYDLRAGDLSQDNVTKTFTPETGPGEGAGPQATAENRITGLRSTLDRILGPVNVDARITDDGVEASLEVAGGSARSIAGFQIDAVRLTARYGTSGQLDVEGRVGLRHTSGRISGAVTLGWRPGGNWSFAGEVTIAEGLIPGVRECTATVEYVDGNWTIGVEQIQIERRIGAVNLTGTGRDLRYDVRAGAFSGTAELEADLGMFGRAGASATIERNELQRVSLSYDSPELKYPPNATSPAITGTIGGTITYENERFHGAIRGTARLAVPALQRIAGEGGLGLAVDAHVNADGTYGGTIRTTSPLRFGDHFQIPSMSLTIADDGALSGDFDVRVVNFRYLERAELGCRIDAEGFHVVRADVRVPFGTPNESRFWGALEVGYAEGQGLTITGDVHMKIKEGMIANGRLTYSTETNVVDLRLSVDEIRILEYGPQRRNLFQFGRQIPIASFYNLVGIYLDIGFDLDFEYEMTLGLRPEITLEGLSMETFEYQRIAAQIELLGMLAARLVATPRVGLGLFAISPSLLRGGGGLQIPITGEAILRPSGRLGVSYRPDGGVDGDASIGMVLTFGIRGAVRPYAEVSVLDGAWNPTWTGDALTEFEIMPPKELFNFQLDLAGDMSQREPTIPTAPQAPSGTSAGRQLPQETPETRETAAERPSRDATPPQTGPTGEADASDDTFNISSLLGGLRGLPGYQTLSGFMDRAGRVWEQIRGFFGRVMGAFRSFFEQMADAVDEIIDGFAAQGLAYLPQLIRRIVGPSVWEVIEPIVNAAAGTAEEILGLFETAPPTSASDFFPWALRLAARVFGIAFDGIGALVNALRTIADRLAGSARRLVTHMVQTGMIGVKRHSYYIWRPWPMDDYHFLAATQYKIHILGVDIDFYDEGMITNPASVVGVGLFEALEAMDIPSTNDAYDEDARDSYRDRWV